MRLVACIAVVLALAPQPPYVRGSRESLIPPRPDIAPGLHVELNTRDGRTAFHFYESIPLEIRISSSLPRKYSIELDDHWNSVAGDVDFLVSPADSAISPLATAIPGIVCCSSRRVFLTRTPEVFQHYLTGHVRFLHAGDYQVQFRTREVFRGAGVKKDMYFARGDVPAISNIITLRILPDDPAWDAATFKQALEILDEPNASGVLEQDRRRLDHAFGPQGPDRRTPRLAPPRATRYYDAQHALQLLDTEEAIRERVRRLEFLGISTRPDLVVTALENQAARSDFGVRRDFVYPWVQALMQRDAPELSSITDQAARADRSLYARAAVNAHKEVLDFLRGVVGSKTGSAFVTTTETIRMLEREK